MSSCNSGTSREDPPIYDLAEALRGLPAPGLAARRHLMESRETMRVLPTLQLFRLLLILHKAATSALLVFTAPLHTATL